MSEDKQDKKNDNVLTDPSEQLSESKKQEDIEEEDRSQEKYPSEQLSESKKQEDIEEEDRSQEKSCDNIKRSSEQKPKHKDRVSVYDYIEARTTMARKKRTYEFISNIAFLISTAIVIVIGADVFIRRSQSDHPFQIHKTYLYFYIVLFVGSIILIYLFLFLLCKAALSPYYSSAQTTIDRYELENMQEKVAENLFESSLKINYKYLDQYYAQTREHAGKGFLITICVTIVGAVLLSLGIISMFIDKTDASKITVASGVIVEFISAIMFYLYNRTVQSMGNYHDKLFLSQNVAMALKVSDSISEENRDEIKSQIVKELITNVNAYIMNSDDKNEKSKEASKTIDKEYP